MTVLSMHVEPTLKVALFPSGLRICRQRQQTIYAVCILERSHLQRSALLIILTDEILRLVKVRSDLDQPGRLHLDHVSHVLLRSQHQLMVDHTLRLVLVQHRTGVDANAHVKLGSFVNFLAVVPGAVHEKPTDDAFADIGVLIVLIDREVLVCHIDLHPLQQPGQLLLHLPRPPQRTHLDEVVRTPLRTVFKLLPSIVNVQQGQMVAPRTEESFLSVVGMHLFIFGTEEHCVAHGQHRADSHGLVDALVMLGTNEHLRQHGLEGKLSHSSAKPCQFSAIIERTQCVEKFESADEHVVGWGIEEVEVDQVVNAHTLQHQDHIADVAALDLRNCRFLELLLVTPQRVESEALPWGHSPSTTGPLVRRGLADGNHDQTVHAAAGVVGSLLDETAVDHEEDVVDGEGGLCDVGGEDALARPLGGGLEDTRLHVRGQARVDRQYDQLPHLTPQPLHTRGDLLHRLLDLVLARHEAEDVSGLLREMDLQDGDHTRLDVISLGVCSVVDIDWKPATRDVDDRRAVEVV